jgi:hypothetical protein
MKAHGSGLKAQGCTVRGEKDPRYEDLVQM